MMYIEDIQSGRPRFKAMNIVCSVERVNESRAPSLIDITARFEQ
jgi:hypothetical protein